MNTRRARIFSATILQRRGFAVEYIAADGRPSIRARHPRVNVVGTRRGGSGPVVHLNGHIDVVPAGDGWTVDPFAGVVRDGRIYGRGVCDMKAGIAAAVFAAEAIARAGIELPGTIEISGTVDEESGGFAGVAHLAQVGRIAKDAPTSSIIPEPLNVDRICIGHRGVYWFEVTARGRIGHGSMPFLGVSAIDGMGRLLQAIRDELMPALAPRKTAVPVVPAGARHATINVNGIDGGQPVDGIQTPCVADVCRAVFDRRFLIEEGFDATRDEIVDARRAVAGKAAGVRFELRDLMVVHPTRTPDDSPVIAALDRSIRRVLGRPAELDRQPGHLRSQARRAHRRRAALRRLRAWRTRARASTGRVLPHRRSRERDQGAGAGYPRPHGRGEIDCSHVRFV